MASTSTGLNSDKNMLYCAVHFFNEDKVEAVPTTWLTMSTDNTIECWWPSQTKNFHSLLKSRVLPLDQENWTREPCKIIKYYATLLEARRKTRNVEYDRNSTSEEEYRRLRKPSKSNFASLNINLTSAATDYSNSPSPASSGICSEEVYQCLDEINKKHNVIIDKLQTLEMQQKIIFEEMGALKIRTLESNRSKSINKAEVYTLEGFTTLGLLPLNSIEEVEDFEVALENEQIKSKYVAHVKIFATPKPDVTIRNCLNSVYTSTLATKCAWTGLKNNYSIKDLKQIAIIKGCRNQLVQLLLEIEDKQQWALTMLEANGEIPVEDSRKAKKLNPFDDCINTNETVKNTSFLGKYCLPAKEFQVHRDWRKGKLLNGVCVPDKCTVSDIIEIYSATQNTFWTTEILCQTKEVNPYDFVAICTITFFGVFFSIIVASTLYDINSHYLNEKPANTLLISFSLLTNGKKILQANNSPEEISCLNGLRVISLISIIVFHTFIIQLQFTKNASYYEQWNSSVYGTMMQGNILSVNTFLVITGLLISFNELKSISKQQKFSIIKHYLNRYLRISSVFFIIVLINLSLMYLGSGPLWKAYAYHYRSNCCTYLWSTLLYIQNIINPERMCIEISWYLSVDMQLFLISPFLLIPLRTRPKLVLAISALLAFLSSISIFGLAWFYGGIFANTYHYRIYGNTLTRSSPWFIGFILGYVLFTRKNSTMNKMWVRVLTIMSITTFMICVYVDRIRNFGDSYVIENSIRISIVYPLWSFSVYWIIYACANGYIDLLNRFLSLRVFQVIAKVSYSAYIIHYTILYFITYTLRGPIIFNAFETMMYGFLYAIIILIIAFFTTIAFEMPVISITKLFLKKV
ncbi:hypothetical protein RN001_008820 [Aquatica leii]|uniref:Nose resistant-to-fluoxetine protein N-terminal domain-containing protein n=1 Tax=Aquatica leii TaxID=1421715 RepID=A0AAN7PAT9_9COLE|nr:hypothetical protein RN001_008820 [Aquatica leii]